LPFLSSFSEEKEAKRLFNLGMKPFDRHKAKVEKVFWFFFQRRTKEKPQDAENVQAMLEPRDERRSFSFRQ
jgi:hypothetical protein